ncbi:MAG: zinc ABC transporter substrate-binding protein [Saprospiraceae bacterium]
MRYLFLFLFLTHYSYASKPIRILTTTSIFKDMIQQIGGHHVEISSIVPLGSDPHTYEANPSDVVSCKTADLIMINGLHLEVWIEKLIQNSKPSAEIITLTNGIPSIKSGAYPDPHAWMSAKNGMVYANNIASAIITKYPSLKGDITTNLQSYLEALKKLDLFITNKVLTIPEKHRVLVTNHDAFRYFGQHYNIQLAPLMGVSTEAEPKTSDIIKIINIVQKTGVPAIFVESSINPQLMNQIAKDLNVSIGGSLYSDSLGDENSGAGTYLGMLQTNTNRIVNALSKLDTSLSVNNASSLNDMMVLTFLTLLFLLLTTLLFITKLNG